MNTKLIGLGVAVVALAGGLSFCGGVDEIEPPANDEITNEYNAHDEPAPDATAMVTLRLARTGIAAPTFWAIQTKGAWSRPALDGDSVQFEVPGEKAPYSIVAVCDGLDAKGAQSIRTTVVEATPRELPDPMIVCGAADAATDQQVSGVIRGANGQPVSLAVGTRTQLVDNPNQARDLVFATNAPTGQRTFVATVGTGEKMKAVSKTVAVEGAVAVELDFADAKNLVSTAFPLSTDGFTRPAGGTANVWIDGRTRLGAGALGTWGKGDPALTVQSTGAAGDYVDMRAAFKGPALPMVEYPPLAHARFITRADGSQPPILPELTWVVPSHAIVSHDRVEFAWSASNWAVFGHKADRSLALFAPIAYVGSAHAVSSVTHHIDVVVTPNRGKGNFATYRVPDLSVIDGWSAKWNFPGGQKVEATTGNLAAYAGTDAVDPGIALAAYLDPGHEAGPADLGINDSLTVVVAGSPVVINTPDKSLADMMEARCFEQRPCAVKIKENALAATECPDLAAYNDCRADPADRFTASPADFVRDLRHEIIRWYRSGAIIPDAVTLDEALSRVSEDNVKRVTDRTADEWYLYDPDVYQVYWHPDPTRVDSPTVWYGAYLAGRLVSIHPVNWQVQFE